MTPLVEELIPCPDPWDVARKLAHLPNLLFLDSADRSTERGRYSYVAADPIEFDVARLYPSYHPTGNSNLDWTEQVRFGVGTTLENFGWHYRTSQRNDSIKPAPNLPPFQGGKVCFLGYEMYHEIEEQIRKPAEDEFGGPHYAYGNYRWVIAFDHRDHRAWLLAHNPHETSPKRNATRQTIENVNRLLRQGPSKPKCWRMKPLVTPLSAHDFVSQHILLKTTAATSNFSRDQYLAAVRTAIDYVHAGDCFQVNLSQRLLAPLREHPLELYGRLRQRNPAPYGCYFDLGDFQILSASPEQFLKVSNGDVVTRPIKGTRPRGKTPEEDARIVRELQANPKDRAENVMIVDLLRNDLGRVCEYGSIHVPKVCEVETFAHVHHLVSEVRGMLRPDRTPFDLLRAAFPGGSVTGAPKVRAMEIIAELEPTARGPYCGSVGFVGFDGSMDSNILIRTFTAGRGWVQFPVGGGIVADSDPETEYEETLHKAKGLLDALEP
jgi:para-aminobenzoate synthetase component 1